MYEPEKDIKTDKNIKKTLKNESVNEVKQIKKKKSSGMEPAKESSWLNHVKKYREGHPDKSYKDCLKCAKETYVK